MRLWHQDLIPYLPRQQLLGQHREICALRGNGWKKKHSTVNYIFLYSWGYLYLFHMKVMGEMKVRGYHPDPKWEDVYYRGKNCNPLDKLYFYGQIRCNDYPEHNEEYFEFCSRLLLERIGKAPDGKYKDLEVKKLKQFLGVKK